jgi:branched-subunit amino acid transport protein
MRWLRHVPVAVMAALIGRELFPAGGKPGAFGDLAAALLAFAAAVLTRSLLATVLAGIAAAMVLRNFPG